MEQRRSGPTMGRITTEFPGSKGAVVKKFQLMVLAVVLGALTAASVASAVAVKKIAFSGTYAGQATTKVDGNVATIAAKGTGNGTGDTSQQPCVPFGGTGKITGSAGTSIAFKVISGGKGCGDEGGHTFSVSGYVSVVNATGKLAKAKGTLKFTGVYDRDDGSFNVKFTGTLTK